MTQKINPAKLRASAEHLEWVLGQYPDSDDIQSLLRSLRLLLDDAKTGHIVQPMDSMDVPGAYNFGDRRYAPYEHPSVESAYADFRIELRGGLSEQERRILAKFDAMHAGSEGRSS